MRQVSFGPAPPVLDEKMRPYTNWVRESFNEIERASFDDAITVVDSYSVANYTELRTIDGTSGTLGDVRNFLCTLINDLKNRGVKRDR